MVLQWVSKTYRNTSVLTRVWLEKNVGSMYIIQPMAQKLETNLKSTAISLFFSAQHLGLHAKLPKGKQNEKSPVFHWKVAILYP